MEGFDNSFVAVAGARNFAAVGAGSFAVVGVVVSAEVEGAEVVDAAVKDVVFADVAMFVVRSPGVIGCLPLIRIIGSSNGQQESA